MSGPYTNHSKGLDTTSSARLWNHLSSSGSEGTDTHGISLSTSSYNETTFYSQATITCSPHLSVQIAHTKNSTNWHTPSALLSTTVDSLPKASTPLLSLQMLVDNRQSQIKNLSEKKDFFESVLNTNTSSIFQKIGQENQIQSIPRNLDKIYESNNISSSHFSTNESHLLDPNLSTSSISMLSTTSYKNDSYYSRNKDVIFKNLSTNFEVNKPEFTYINHDKYIDNIHSSPNALNFSSDVTIEKIDIDKKEIDNSKATQRKNSIPTTLTLISKLDKIIKEDSHETYLDTKKKVNEYSLKSSKSFFKKGKKGVDSLLEKLENCSKRFYNIDNVGSTITSHEEKDTNSIRSISPEYCKSRSPNNREDEVVSPSFSNDDSNDTKQRRKRKLGKPIRLSKELKLEHEDIEFEIMKHKLRTKSEILNSNNKNLLPQNSLLSTYTQNKQISNPEFDIIKKNDIETYSVENQENDSKLKITNFDLRSICVFKNKGLSNEDLNNHNNFNTDLRSEKKNKINMSQYLIQALKDSKSTRSRRNSECSINVYNINKKKRRKSCDDVQGLLHESISISTLRNNIITFNEVESQLEKMFAGIIENDKDLLKKTLFESEKSIALLSDEDQKENVNNEKLNVENIYKTISETRSNHYKINKKKNLPKIRSHKKKNNSCKVINNASINSLPKDKKRQGVDKRSLKKTCVLKRKKKDIKIDTLREIICDSSMNTTATKYKGPIIQIRGSKMNPLYVQIVNIPREDDEERNKEKRKNMGNGNISRSKRLHYQNNLDYRGKVCNTGLFNSTLSIRYDAHTADVTWICVFCKRGPHFLIPGDSARPHPNVAGPHIIPGTYTVPAGVLSDLFGPYIIGKDLFEDTIMSPDEYEIMKEQKQGNKNKRSLRYAGIADQFVAKISKKKKKFLNNVSNIYMGMTMYGCDEQQWEVWIHEECIIWAAGVYITGGRISGLQDAVWDSSKSVCNSCGLSGANIGCIKRGCKSVTHYCCALTSGWQLDIKQYIPKCNIHRIT